MKCEERGRGEPRQYDDRLGTGDSDSGDIYGRHEAAAVFDIAGLGGIARLVVDDPGSVAALDNALLSIYFGFVFGVVHGAAICDAENVPLALYGEMGASIMPVMVVVM